MSHISSRLLLCMLALVCLDWLGGCQSQTATQDADLPPLRLTPPPVAQRPAVAPARPTYASASAQPTAAPAPTPTAIPPSRPAPTAARAAAIPASWIPAVAPNNWNWIIIHHSDSDYGSAAIIDKWHRDRGFDELGYHFVIGNGTNSGDGQIEVGPRWVKQKWGAHDNALDNRFNTNGIGICLVGDFNKTRPTAKQRRALLRLVVYLMRTYHIPPDRVLGHGETKVTQCPGRYLNVADMRDTLARMLAQGDTGDGADPVYADGGN
jgi:N-acetylmuramoyl-L-alanine amidase